MENFCFNIKIENQNAKIPERATPFDAGLDVFSIEDYTLYPGERKLFNLGFKGSFPKGYVCDVRSKSGRTLKEGLIVLNQPGTIDSHYRGDYGVILFNSNISKPIEIKKGEKIAQLIFTKCEIDFVTQVVGALDDTERSTGGFGSTGV